MITEQDLQEAIAECNGVRNPNAGTCMKLAAFYVIRDHLFPKREESEEHEFAQTGYSFALPQSQSVENTIEINSDSEFAEVSNGLAQDAFLGVMDELMSTLSVVNPRLYDSVLRKLRQ